MDKTQPLALPKGSVRSILALGLTISAIAATFLGIDGNEFLWPAALVANGFYFGSRPGPDPS